MKFINYYNDEIINILNICPKIVKNYIYYFSPYGTEDLIIIPFYIHIDSMFELFKTNCDFKKIIINNKYPFKEIEIFENNMILIYNSWEFWDINDSTFINNYYQLLKKLKYPKKQTILSVKATAPF